MKENKIGFLEELQPNGSVAKSSTRLWSAVFASFTIALVSFLAYQFSQHIDQLFDMAGNGKIDQGAFVSLIQSMKIIDPFLLSILLLAVFAPKYIQKIAEIKLGKLSELPKQDPPQQ
jgi:hypothetical protein